MSVPRTLGSTYISINEFYDSIIEFNQTKSPRGLKTYYLNNTSFMFKPGHLYTRPGGNPTIGFIELLQFIIGAFRIDTFQRLTPNARLDLFTHQSAYGPRVLNQWNRVLSDLKSDKETRRAVLMIAHPGDTPETIPCTLSMQFQIENGELFTSINMRSSDLIWGLPTDLIQFGGIITMVANILNVRAGTAVVNAANSHVYESTKMKDGEHFSFKGLFVLPHFEDLISYRLWAIEALYKLESGEVKIHDVFELRK